MALRGKGHRGRQQRELSPEETKERCEAILRGEETEWEHLFIALRASPLGYAYPADVFIRTPVSHISWLLEEVNIINCEKANVVSYTAAQLTSVVLSVAYGFAGGKGPKPTLTPKDFLPYPDIERRRNRGANKGPSEAAATLLKRLLRESRIPIHVFTALITPLTEGA